MLLRGGRRAPLLEFGPEPGGFEVIEADVLGVVADSAPGEGVEDSAMKADGDSGSIIGIVLGICVQHRVISLRC